MKLQHLLSGVLPSNHLGCIHSLVLFAIVWLFQPLQAQDIHFSQFYNAPLNLNPALTGLSPGDQRFGANYRQQWASVPVPYTTFSGAYDQKLYLPWLGSGFFGGGLVFNYDKAGDAKLSWAQLGVNAAYTQQITDEQFLSAGFQLLGGQRAFDPQQLRFDDQYNGDIFDESIPTAEAFMKTAVAYIDFGAGINWYFQEEGSRTRIYVGLGFYHLNRPNISFLGDQGVQLPMNGRTYAMATVQLQERLDLVLNGLWNYQGAYQEGVFGGAVRYHLSQERGQELALQLGISYRMSDAMISHFEVFYQNWHLGISYDINTSPFYAATNRNGGPELSLRYIITKVKPPDTFKACPIF